MIWLYISISVNGRISDPLSLKMSLYMVCLETKVESLLSKLASLAGAFSSFGGACCRLAPSAFALTSWLKRYSILKSRASRASMANSKVVCALLAISRRWCKDVWMAADIERRGKIPSNVRKGHDTVQHQNLRRKAFCDVSALISHTSQPRPISSRNLCWSPYH